MHRYTFEIVPTDWDGISTEGLAFQPMLMDVPALALSEEMHDRAARRAYFQAFHLLGPKGIEPEDFAVWEWDEYPGRGRQVDRTGLLD